MFIAMPVCLSQPQNLFEPTDVYYCFHSQFSCIVIIIDGLMLILRTCDFTSCTDCRFIFICAVRFWMRNTLYSFIFILTSLLVSFFRFFC